MPPDGTCNDIAGRKLRAGDTRHEAIAISIDQDRAFSAYGLTDELQWRGLAVERRRMELDKFKIGHDGAGACCEREALAKGSSRICPMLKQTSNATGRDDDAVGGKEPRSRAGMAKKTHHCIVLDDQALCRGSLDHRDRRRLTNPADQSSNNVPACCITPGMDDPAARMRGLEARTIWPLASRSKMTPSRANCSIAAGAAARIAGRDGFVAQAITGSECVCQMQRSTVIRPDTGSDTALRQRARRFRAQRRAGQEQHRLRRQRQGRHQAGDAAADDDRSAVRYRAIAVM